MSKAASNDYGSAHWATREDLSERRVGDRIFPSMVRKESERPHPGAWMLGPAPWGRSERIDLSSFQSGQHVMYLGPTGMGKTTLILPNVIFSQATAMVIADPKGETWRLTSGYRPVAVRLAALDPDHSACFNWIPPCKDDWHYSLLTALSIVEADGGKAALRFHRGIDGELLAAIQCHVAHSKHPTPASVYDFLTHPDHANGNWLKPLAASASQHARDVAAVFSNGKAQVRGEALMSLANMLGWMKDDRIRRFTSASNSPPDWRNLREEKAAIYWVLPIKDQAPLRTLTTLFWNCALHGMMQAGESGTKVKFVFDELANIGKIQSFSEHITTVRGLGLDFVMCLQSLSQLAGIYGDDEAATIFSNALTKVIIGGITDTQILDQIVKLLGTKTVTRRRMTETKKGFFGGERARSYSDHELGVPLMFASQIETLADDLQLVLSGNRPPWVGPRFSWSHQGREKPAGSLGPVLTSYPKNGEKLVVEEGKDKGFPKFEK